MISKELIYSKSNFFLKLEIDGYLKLYSYFDSDMYYDSYNIPHIRTIQVSLLQKGNDGRFTHLDNIRRKKEMIHYFSDCPDLASLISRKAFRRNNIKKIINYYNLNCKNK